MLPSSSERSGNPELDRTSQEVGAAGAPSGPWAYWVVDQFESTEHLLSLTHDKRHYLACNLSIDDSMSDSAILHQLNFLRPRLYVRCQR